MIHVPQTLFRVSGMLLLIAGLANFVVQIVHLEDVPKNLAQLSYFVDVAVGTHVAMLLSTPLLLIGITGLYVRQAEVLKWWGWLSYFLIFTYFTFELIHAILQIYQYPVLFADVKTEEALKAASDIANKTLYHDGFPTVLSSVAFPAVLIGFLLATIAMYRARVYSKWAALMVFLMPISFFLPWDSMGRYIFPVSLLVYVWYGALLAFEKRQMPQVETPSSHIAS